MKRGRNDKNIKIMCTGFKFTNKNIVSDMKKKTKTIYRKKIHAYLGNVESREHVLENGSHQANMVVGLIEIIQNQL
jgi:hypothetical protein